MRDTFIIRTEWYAAIVNLTDKEQAIILRNLFEYHSGNLENVDTSTLSLQLVWSLIAPNLKRNIDKYDHRCETSAENGKKGGRPAKNKKPKKPISKPKKPIKTLNDSDSDSDSEYDSVSEKKKKYRKNVSLSKSEYDRLLQELGIEFLDGLLNYYSDYKTEKQYKTGSDNLSIRRWVIDAYRKKHVPVVKLSKAYDPYDRKNYWNDAEYEAAMEKLKSNAV